MYTYTHSHTYYIYIIYIYVYNTNVYTSYYAVFTYVVYICNNLTCMIHISYVFRIINMHIICIIFLKTKHIPSICHRSNWRMWYSSKFHIRWFTIAIKFNNCTFITHLIAIIWSTENGN